MHCGRLVFLVVETHCLDDILNERPAVGLVIDSVVGTVSDACRLDAQNLGEDGVERSHIELTGCFIANNLAYAVFHLAGSLVGEGKGKDSPWLHALLQEISYLVSQHARLA